METKEFKIQVPEGYEIDKEHSTFECIKFKPIKQKLTYKVVVKELFKENKEFFIIDDFYILPADCNNKDIEAHLNCTSPKQANKLIAINKLMNVAKYLNGDWRPNWNDDEKKYHAYTEGGYIKITYATYFNCMNVYFKSAELVGQAIEILGKETIKTALSTDW